MLRVTRPLLAIATSVVVFVVMFAGPAAACSIPLPLFTVSTTAGGPGTAIEVSTYCQVGGSVVLRFPIRSDAPRPVIDSASFPPGDGAHVTLHNTYAPRLPAGTPYLFDMEVGYSCGDVVGAYPFLATQSTTTEDPRVYTTPADGPCGYLRGAPIACPPNVRGFNAQGAVAGNFYADVEGRGASFALDRADNRTVHVIGSGPDAPATFRWSAIGRYDAYPAFRGGVNLAVGDLDGDGVNEIVTAPGPGGGPHVKIWRVSSGPVSTCGPTLYEDSGFMAYDEKFAGGVSVAIADVDNDGRNDIITGAGPGGGPHVRIFDRHGNAWHEFMAYAPSFRGGVSVAAGDVAPNSIGDEVITGAGAGGGPHVRVFSRTGRALSDFFAYVPEFTGGVHVAAGHAIDDNSVHIVTGPGAGGGPHVRVFDAVGAALSGFYAYEPSLGAGVRVAVAP